MLRIPPVSLTSIEPEVPPAEVEEIHPISPRRPVIGERHRFRRDREAHVVVGHIPGVVFRHVSEEERLFLVMAVLADGEAEPG